MDKIRAPYNFVPVAPEVRFVEYDDDISHDRPFEDGITAVLEYGIEAETPIFVRGQSDSRGQGERFFRTPDDKFAIPGSAVRGMLRNVVEIASFGKLSRLNDHTYGVRDLHNREVYLAHMAEIAMGPGGKKMPMPTVSAGWLRLLSETEIARRHVAGADPKGDVVAEITACDFYKIEYRRLMEMARQAGAGAFDPGRKQSSKDKYDAWGNRPLEVEVEVERLRLGESSDELGIPFLGEMGRVVTGGARVKGSLVFTGQPQRWAPDLPAPRPGAGHPKHHDFVFVDQASPTVLPVTRAQLGVFDFVHADRGQQGRMKPEANAEWKFWKDRLENKRSPAAPVFVLPYGERNQRGAPRGSLRAFGLAMMFRLAYDHSIGDLAKNAQPQRDAKGFDLAEAIFGTVPLEAKSSTAERHALKGRVSVGLAVARGTPKELSPVRAVLGSPKASYYPNYVEQSDSLPGGSPTGGRYVTYMDDKGRIRGWKRYRPHAAAEAQPVLPAKASDKVISSFRPLVGATFAGRIRIHNLRAEELGALVWAARFGGDASARHTLGMARSLGYGRVRLTVQTQGGQPLVTNSGESVSLPDCEARFVAAMEKWASGTLGGPWATSLEVGQLLACALPLPAGSDEGRHMMLDHPVHRNEFTAAKKDRLALAAALPVKKGARRPVAATGGAALAGAGPVRAGATASAVSEKRGTIKWFRTGKVAILLDDGTEHKVDVSTSTFDEAFGPLNGNTLRQGRIVVAGLRGDRVARVRPA